MDLQKRAAAVECEPSSPKAALDQGVEIKVGIVGAGAVGSACLLSVVLRGSAREVVVIDRNREKARGVVTDVQYGTVLTAPMDVREGGYSDLAGAAVVMITAGVNEKVEARQAAAIRWDGFDCWRRTRRFSKRWCRRSRRLRRRR